MMTAAMTETKDDTPDTGAAGTDSTSPGGSGNRRSSRPRAADARTPMMKQYLSFKEAHPDEVLFFRMGDFYEMFFEDAEIVSEALGLTLTRRSSKAESYPMAGIPYHALDRYLPRMIESGFRVAICEQVEDPADVKGRSIVEREIVDIVTPGTLTDERYLEPGDPCFSLMIVRYRSRLGLAWLDISTGQFLTLELPARTDLLEAEIQRIQPREILLPDKVMHAMGAEPPERGEKIRTDADLGHLVDAARDGVMLSPVPDWTVERKQALRALCEHFEVSGVEGFGLERESLAVTAAGALLQYAGRMKAGRLGALRPPKAWRSERFVRLDGATIRTLELVSKLRGRESGRHGTLLGTLDKTVTNMGSRLLRDWILSPLLSREEIEQRHDVVTLFREDGLSLAAFREALRGVHDLERLAQRMASGRATPRDLANLRASLQRMPALHAAARDLLERARAPVESFEDLLAGVSEHVELRTRLEETLDDAPALSPSEGPIIRDGFNADLDQLRGLATEGETYLENYRLAEAERTGISSLKIGNNKVFGYYLEVTNAHKDKVPPDYIRKQTLKNAERYITPDLKEFEEKILSATEKSVALEGEIFQALRELAAESARALQVTAEAVAQLDVLAGFADLAGSRGYVRPTLRDDERIAIRAGRHPVVDAMGGEEPFVPNDFRVGDEDGLVAIITGPNMAGKSTYIRQVALLVHMAQIGCFVPADEAEIGLVDRIFTRIGSADELTRGLSTFMVEMVETANILNNASSRSLIVLDEVGRGTSTYDGVSIAWAMTEYIHNKLGARTLFATHYHELTALSQELIGVRNYSVSVREWQDEIVFLRKIIQGGADKSYGIQVARLAGVPKTVIRRAKVILAALEDGNVDADGAALFTRHLGGRRHDGQMSLFSAPQPVVMEEPEPDPVREAVEALNINDMTPLEALMKLKELQDLAREEGDDPKN